MRSLLTSFLVSLATLLIAQPEFTRQDTLRGSITPEREWWDLTYYHLSVEVHPENKTLDGSNLIQYKVLSPYKVMQIDLQPPLQLTKAEQDGQELEIVHEGNAHFIQLKKDQTAGSIENVLVHFSGTPKEAIRPPWDGGVTWQKDSNGKHFIATSCQGIGASIWWPNKDHMYDEVDSMLISITIPRDLMNVSNGRLRGIDKNRKDKTITTHWFVSNPINNYGVNFNIGDYVHWNEKYAGENGELDLDYWVLKENESKAREQFKQTPMMMAAFEHWFGPYPFYKDGFKLVEAPYLGMEHQSSITYGNQYQNGYLGRDLSQSGWGLKFDFIIIHEAGHEWFANNITYVDIADMWVHESFTNYSENLYVEYHFGKEAGAEYVRGTRSGINNDRPIQGIYNVNYRGSGDMYPKGGNMLHTLRQIINDDEKWRSILRGLNEEFYHQTVYSEQIENYISRQSGMNLKPFFDQYLRDIRIPVLEYKLKGKQLYYRWNNSVDDFDMPVQISLNGDELWLKPTTGWATIDFEVELNSLEVDPDYYVGVLNITGE